MNATPILEWDAPAAAPAAGPSVPRRRRTGAPRAHRTVFLSDTHLGTPGVEAARLLEFLADLSCERLYLIGDIVDFSSMRRRVRWEAAHGQVLARILELQASGTRVTYVPGNHDWIIRGYEALEIGGIRVEREAVHETADGRRFLIVHGDRFDATGRLATLMSDLGIAVVHAASRLTNFVRESAGLSYWPLGSRLRARFQHLIPHVARFEAAAVREARAAGFDGVICGHLHIAAMKSIEGVLYCNTGDWVDSCTAIREEHWGALSLFDATVGGERAGRRYANAQAPACVAARAATARAPA